jgi:hypothetical protein
MTRLALAILLKIAVTSAVLLGMAGVAVASAYVTTPLTSAGGARWGVTVGSASQPLYPGVDVTIPYRVRNSAGSTQTLSAITATVTERAAVNREVPNPCSPNWFTVHTAATSPRRVPPGTVVHGNVTLDLSDLSLNTDACKNVALDVNVTAS